MISLTNKIKHVIHKLHCCFRICDPITLLLHSEARRECLIYLYNNNNNNSNNDDDESEFIFNLAYAVSHWLGKQKTWNVTICKACFLSRNNNKQYINGIASHIIIEH